MINEKRLVQIARENKQGFTASLNGDLLNLNKGYAVSITNNNGKNIKQLVRNLSRAEPLFSTAKNLFVGGWLSESKVFFLDFTLIVKSLREARAIAQEFSQEAVFNFKSKSSIVLVA